MFFFYEFRLWPPQTPPHKSGSFLRRVSCTLDGLRSSSISIHIYVYAYHEGGFTYRLEVGMRDAYKYQRDFTCGKSVSSCVPQPATAAMLVINAEDRTNT